MDHYLSLHFPTRTAEIKRLRQTNRKFYQICAEFDEIAEEKGRVEAVIFADQSGSEEVQNLIDLGNTLNGLKLEILQFVANGERKDKQYFQEEE